MLNPDWETRIKSFELFENLTVYYNFCLNSILSNILIQLNSYHFIFIVLENTRAFSLTEKGLWKTLNIF